GRDRRAQFQGAPASKGNEKGLYLLFLSHRRRETGRRDRRGHSRSVPRSNGRKKRAVGSGHDGGRQAVAQSCNARGHQGRTETEGYGTGQIRASIGAAGDRGRVEVGLQNGRAEIGRGQWLSRMSILFRSSLPPWPPGFSAVFITPP